ncbi:hypothetical protein Y032_0086g1935 [Ancylostoma ceylanicum]|uniref:Uncharacterized protein n=1 Tax=Ancylostoma ceylanicum TaxID=53326 RepID=A0A016TPN9_9BILA|nr:hypothetical protein Y032_0086g1935 [Ancylostoma ceylanicum]
MVSPPLCSGSVCTSLDSNTPSFSSLYFLVRYLIQSAIRVDAGGGFDTDDVRISAADPWNVRLRFSRVVHTSINSFNHVMLHRRQKSIRQFVISNFRGVIMFYTTLKRTSHIRRSRRWRSWG